MRGTSVISLAHAMPASDMRDAVIGMVADLQDPPEMIPDFVREWENGYSMVLAIKRTSGETR